MSYGRERYQIDGDLYISTLANKLAADEITTVPAIVCMHIAYQ